MTPEWTTSCIDWEDRIVKQQSLIPAPLFPEEAEYAISVMKQLRIVDVAGSPRIGECCAPWVFDFAAAVFGAYDGNSGKRLIKEFFLQVPKKNSKALALNTLIPVPSGWKTMGELQVGDQVFGTNGKPCNVIAVSDIFTDHKCYELEFSNGEKVIADAGHQWVTETIFIETAVRTTQEIVNTIHHMHLLSDGRKVFLCAGEQIEIVSAKEVPPVPVKCISVDAENKQFLFGKTMLPTHNSSIAASIMITAMIVNWRPSAEMIILAPTHEVALNAYKPARDMIKADEELDALFLVQDHIKTITHRRSGASLKVVAADQNTVGGKKASIVLIDEIHIFGKNANAENMFREATGGLAARPEGCIIYLTTQSDQPPAGVYRQKLQYARDVRDGLVDDKHFLPIIYEFPKKMLEANQHKDPKNFKLVNPNMGYSVDEEYLVREFQKAEREGETSMLGFMSKFLNVEIGLALRSDRWAGADFWVRNGIKTLTFDQILEKSEVISIGIDGGGLDDLLGMAIVGRDKEDPRIWYAWAHAWAHPSVLERRKEIAPRIQDFAKLGQLTLVEKIGDDVIEVADIVEQIWSSDLMDRIGVDPVGISAILDEIEARDIPADKIVGVSQGWKMGGAIKTTERKLAEGTLKHPGSEMMAWVVSNAKIENRANSILVTKQASGTGKIDPLMALFNAMSLMGMNPEAKTQRFQMLVF